MDNLSPGDTEGQTVMQEEATGEISEENIENINGVTINGNVADSAKTLVNDSNEIEGDELEHLKTNEVVDIEESIEERCIENPENDEEKEPLSTMDEVASLTESESSINEHTAAAVPESEETEVKEKDEWLDILGNGFLKKKVTRAGKEGSSRPGTGQEVCIKTEGSLADDNRVDVFEAQRFILGDGDVITAWDLCVATMVEGEVCQLITAPRFAYGAIGKEDENSDIPPDSTIIYTLELISITRGPDIPNLTDEQRIELGDKKRERGNELFRREDYPEAVYSYSRALKYLEPSTSEEVMELKVKCWNNIGASHLKVKEYAAAKTACDAVLEVQPENVKALFRKGKVLVARREFEEALELLRKANLLDPDNKLVRRELIVAKQKFDEGRKKERGMYQRMINGLRGDSITEDTNSFFTWPVILGIGGVALGGIVAALLLSRH